MKFFMLFLVFAMCSFGKDATMEIVKYMNKAPKVILEDGTNNDFSDAFKMRFFKMMIGDLKVTTHFNPIEKYIRASYEMDPILTFGDFRPNLVIQYKLEKFDGNKILARVRVVNAATKQMQSQRTYRISDAKSYPFLSHNIVCDINDELGAPSVDWMKKYVLIARNVGHKESQIDLADYTLTFNKPVVKGGLNLFPKWADARQSRFYYTSYSDREPTLYEVDLKSGHKRKILSSQGMLVVSDVSDDGRYLLLTMAPHGQPDIYRLDTRSGAKKQITFYKGIDVNGGFVDGDKKIVFVSDRLGYPNVFSKKIHSRSVEQMIYRGRNNNAVSSHGNYIVYSSRDKASEFGSSTFNLYLISTKTEYIRQLTATGKNLFPRFSKDGQSIAFIKSYGAKSALGIIRLSENKTFHFPLQVGKIQSIDW
ncbi:MAG: Tol-Pal system protein TolB [Proteobacteria bacterium]|nr:MAG: Tol-Pal system protein TolB [Pseudomonadota bacterium]